MKIRNILLLLATTMAVPGLLAGCAAPQPGMTSVSDDQIVTVTAVVESIDLAKRAVLLRGPKGGLQTVFVGEQARNLDQVKAGDRVTISYREAIAAEIVAPGSPGGAPAAVIGGVRAPQGAMPGGAVGGQVQTRVMIRSVDLDTNTVTFVRPDGLVRVVAVRRPLGQQFIRGLKPGDEVDLTYSEALAISVQPAN